MWQGHAHCRWERNSAAGPWHAAQKGAMPCCAGRAAHQRCALPVRKQPRGELTSRKVSGRSPVLVIAHKPSVLLRGSQLQQGGVPGCARAERRRSHTDRRGRRAAQQGRGSARAPPCPPASPLRVPCTKASEERDSKTYTDSMRCQHAAFCSAPLAAQHSKKMQLSHLMKKS